MTHLKLINTFLLIVTAFIYTFAQDVTLTSQSQLNAFNPSTNIIYGNLTLGSASGSNINDLSNLSNLSEIRGNLLIYRTNLSHVDPLVNLDDLDGDLEILDNYNLLQLNGFTGLSSLDGNLIIEDNDQLSNIDGLSNITSIQDDVLVDNNNDLMHLNGFYNLNSVGGYLYISGNDSMTNAAGLLNLNSIGGYFRIRNNDAMTQIGNLFNLTSIGEHLYIEDNDAMTEIGNLSGITSMQDLIKITYNNSLVNLTGFEGLSFLQSGFEIRFNNSLMNINGLENLSSSFSYLWITDNPLLENINGLSGLNSIEGAINIENNSSLTDLNGLSNLFAIGSNFDIQNNDALKELGNWPSLTYTIGKLSITENDSLINLDGLASITDVGALEIINNSSLENINGLANLSLITSTLSGTSTSISIYNNSMLSNCCGIQPILSMPSEIAGSVSIYSNPSECSNESQILASYCAPRLYVDHTATGSNTGSSWTNAFTDLQDALALAIDSVTIHIAAGTYQPTTSTSRGISFELHHAVTLQGGFPNGGGNRDLNQVTILSGDIDGVDTYDGNSFHVVKAIDIDYAILDGIHIKDGNADNANSFSRARGGGIYCKGSTIKLINCVVRRNKAIYGGGLFATLSPEVIIEDSEVKLNSATYGSALYHSNETNLYLNRTKIINNTASNRCAIEVNNSLYTEIDNCLIANNNSTNANAIALIATNRDQTCNIKNSTILGESNNKYLMTLQIGFNDQLNLTIDNSIVAHQNLNFDKNVKAFNNGTLNFNHNNCYFQGATVIGNGTNTLLSDTAGDLLLNVDYSVDECSPVVNMGDNNLSNSSIDILGNYRVFNNTVDMGAFEVQDFCFIFPRKENDIQENITNAVNIYPNPASGILYIETELENITIHISDILGKKILQSHQQKEIDVSALNQGIYLMQIYQKGEIKMVEKLIVE